MLVLSFRKVGPGVLCTTMLQRILQVLFLSFWRNKGSPCYPIDHTPVIQCQQTFLSPKLKIVMKGTRIKAVSSIEQTVPRKLKAIWDRAFSLALDLLYERCKRCAEVGGDCIE
jgi:hypothetical protein